MNNQAILPASIQGVAKVMFRHRRIMLATFLIVTAIAAFATCMMANVYRAEAKMLIRLGRENLSSDPSVPGSSVNPTVSRENDVNSELSIMTSRHLAEALVDDLGESAFLGNPAGGNGASDANLIMEVVHATKIALRDALASMNLITLLSPRDKAIKAAGLNLSAQVERRTNIISATYEAKSPELAATILDNTIRKYIDRHIEVYSMQAWPDFFDTQSEALRVELAERERALEDYRAQYGISTLERQKESLLQRISTLENQVDDASAQVSGTGARIVELRRALAARPSKHELSRTTGHTNYAADALKERLADLHLDETEMSDKYPPDHRPLLQLREQIKRLESSLKKESGTLTEVTTGVDSNHEQLSLSLNNEQAQMKAHAARKEVLEAELEKQNQELALLSSREMKLNELTRDVGLAETEYRQYRESLQRAKVSMALDLDNVSNVSVVQPATVYPSPIRPNRPLNILLGAIAGAVLAVFLAFAIEYFDDSMNTKEDIESLLGVPVLAVFTEDGTGAPGLA